MVEAIKRRDKHCQLHGVECKEKSGEYSPLVVDHCISRTHKSTFFDERNLNLICRKSNWLKFKRQNNIAQEIAALVVKRWGLESLEDLNIQKRIPKKWSIGELEALVENFDSLYHE